MIMRTSHYLKVFEKVKFIHRHGSSEDSISDISALFVSQEEPSLIVSNHLIFEK